MWFWNLLKAVLKGKPHVFERSVYRLCKKDLTNEDDKMSVRFGSLNQQDGEHYLDVAITRAKYQIIIIVCSFNPHNIDVENEVQCPRRLCLSNLKSHCCSKQNVI